jgi:hypothetical protein
MRIARLLLALVLGSVLTIGCGGGGGGGSGLLALRLTDAPFPSMDCLSHAWIDVTGVEVQGEAGWTDIPIVGGAPATFDLLQLHGGLDEMLAVGDLPTGTYHQVRLHLTGATLEFTDGTTKSFQVPSGMQTGIKINVNPSFLIAAGQTTPILLDFSLADSFHVTGVGGSPTCDDLRTNQTVFNPVIHAVNLDSSGVLAGVVYYSDGTTAAPGITVTVLPAGATQDTAPVTTTLSADGTMPGAPLGSYATHLDPGAYDLYGPGDTDGDGNGIDLLASGVLVVSGQLTGQDLTTSVAAP